MEIGINSFAGGLRAMGPNRFRAAGTALAGVLARAERADQVGLDVFGLGEHY